MPPEYMSPEQRAARAEELQHAISREWLRYAITEAIVVFLPLGIFLLVYLTTDSIPDSALMPVAIALLLVLMTPLLAYFLIVRIKPLQRELARLQELDGDA
jgi:hypothetical protein